MLRYIRCTTLLPPFFRNSRLYYKKLVYIYDSKYCPSLATTFSHLSVAYESRVEKTGHLLRLSTNRSNFLFLHKTGSAGQSGRVPLIETSDSQRKQRLKNTADGIGLPISTFQVCLDHFRNMGSSIVMLQNHFIVSLVVLRPFVFQCSAQTHQLRSIPIACDFFSRF